MLSFYDQLTNEEKMLVNSEIQNEGKSPTIAFLLWFFTGTFGGHNFYLGNKGAAVAQLVLNILGWLTAIILIGWVFWAIVGIWAFVDVFTISSKIKATNEYMRESKAQRMITIRQNQAQ